MPFRKDKLLDGQNNPLECNFLCNYSDNGEESSSESDDGLDDEQDFFNSIFKHNMKNEVLRPKRNHVSSSVDWDDSPKGKPYFKFDFDFDSDSDSDESHKQKPHFNFDFGSDDEGFDITARRRAQNYGMLSADEFVEHSKDVVSKSNCSEPEEFFNMIANQFQEFGRKSTKVKLENDLKPSDNSKLHPICKSNISTEIKPQPDEYQKIKEEIKAYDDIKQNKNMLKLSNLPQNEGQKLRIVAKKL